jgi:hypothetical protein
LQFSACARGRLGKAQLPAKAGDVTNSGDENGLGCLMGILLKNPGSFADYGVTNFVTIGGVNVANYRSLRLAPGPVGTVMGLYILYVQVGTLSGLSNGTEYAVSVTVNGTGPANPTSGGFYQTPSGRNLSFIPNPGSIYWVDPTSGNDSNAGTFAAPFQHVQTYNGSSQFGGALFGPVSGRTTTNQTRPGSHIYMRGGEYGSHSSYQGFWVNFWRSTGIAPTGADGTGPIVFTAYPGAAGSNSPDTVTWTGDTGTAGGLQGPDTDRSNDTNVWGTIGYFHYIEWYCTKIAVRAGAGVDAAPINRQTGGMYCHFACNELSWPSNTGSPTAAGIAGEGKYWSAIGNYIHDIYDASGSQQNHGIYIGTNTNADSDQISDYHGDVGFNYFDAIHGGSGINARGAVGTSPADSAPYLMIYCNWFNDTYKHGVNLFDNRARAFVWGNVFTNIGQSVFYCDSDNVTTTNGIYFAFNTAYSWGTFSGAAYPAVYMHGSSNTGNVFCESNVFYQLNGAPAPAWDVFYLTLNGLSCTFAGNRWYDPNGRGSKPTGDTTGTTGDPSWVTVGSDYHPAAGSPLLNAGVTPSTVTLPWAYDIYGQARPQTGATKWAIGAIERVV